MSVSQEGAWRALARASGDISDNSFGRRSSARVGAALHQRSGIVKNSIQTRKFTVPPSNLVPVSWNETELHRDIKALKIQSRVVQKSA